MQTTIKIWNGHPAVKLDPEIIRDAGLSIGQSVLLRAERGQITIEPKKPIEHDIVVLVAGITESNQHSSSDAFPLAGREFW